MRARHRLQLRTLSLVQLDPNRRLPPHPNPPSPSSPYSTGHSLPGSCTKATYAAGRAGYPRSLGTLTRPATRSLEIEPLPFEPTVKSPPMSLTSTLPEPSFLIVTLRRTLWMSIPPEPSSATTTLPPTFDTT